jgi:hypothetical protein
MKWLGKKIGLVCLIQCILTQPAHAQTTTDNFNYFQVEEPDPEIAIECWMTDFSIPALTSAQSEPDYEVKTWMFDETRWINRGATPVH